MQLAALAALQLDALPAGLIATPEGDVEECRAVVDRAASEDRAVRHQDGLARGTAALGQSNLAPYATEGPGAPLYAASVARFIDALALPHISGAEIVAVHSRVSRKGVANVLPPPWGVLRLAYCLVYEQRVRNAAGGPLRFTSLHRSPDYNRSIGGVTLQPQHVACTARDRLLVGQSPRELQKLDVAFQGQPVRFSDLQRAALTTWRMYYALDVPFQTAARGVQINARGVAAGAAGFDHRGGVGLYLVQGFVHADTRGRTTLFFG